MSKRSFIYKQIISTALIILCLIQCKPSTPEQMEINKMHDEIMVIHDEVMPLMKDTYKLRRQLKTASNTSPEVQALITALDDADEAMMDWMAGYDKPSTSDDNYQSYLDQQMTDVNKMKDLMLHSIDNARKYLQ